MEGNEELCDGGCGRVLGVIRNIVQVEDGVCFVCQSCFRNRKMEISIDENKELYMSGFLVGRQKGGKSRV